MHFSAAPTHLQASTAQPPELITLFSANTQVTASDYLYQNGERLLWFEECSN
eukprot:m.639 g.639  ORF g.639 m.639 type:complete len:52 (+) comp300_c0_seq1:22-177(+)